MPIEKYNSQTVTKPFQIFSLQQKTEKSLHSHFFSDFFIDFWRPEDETPHQPDFLLSKIQQTKHQNTRKWLWKR